jgi:antitoxin ParD1/3/4
MMPIRSVQLTPALDRFVADRVESGSYVDDSEVVRAALRTMEREEQAHEAKLELLRKALHEGDTGGLATGDIFAEARAQFGLADYSSELG